MRAVRPGAGPCPGGADVRSNVDAVALERRPDRRRVAGVVGRSQARTGLDDRRRHAEPDIDLGELAAGRATAKDEQALRELPGEGGLLVRPQVDVVDALDRRPARDGADGHDHGPCLQLVRRTIVANDDPAMADDRRFAAVHDGAGLLESTSVARVVGLGGAGRSIDHVVALRRRPRPVVCRGVGVMLGGAVEQRLRWQAADVRTTATEPAAIDDGDAGTQLARLVRRGLAGRAGADDDDVERRGHPVSLPASRLGRVVGGLRITGRPRSPTRSGCRRSRASAGRSA